MLRYTFKEEAAASAIEAAVERVIASVRTGDIWVEGCKRVGTEEMGSAIAEAVL
jgi:3-isopropylmalate dehydrogenase